MASFSFGGLWSMQQAQQQQQQEDLISSSKQSLETLLLEYNKTLGAPGGSAVNASLSSSSSSSSSTTSETLTSQLAQIKLLLYGNSDQPVVDEAKALEIARGAPLLVQQLIENLDKLPFEARKDVALIFNNLVRKTGCDFVEWVFENFSTILKDLVHGYKNPDIALSCGSMLRECIRHENLARALLNSEYLWLFFDEYAHLPNFEVALDAINTLRDLLISEKSRMAASEFVESHYTVFFKKYEVLLLSGNYVTRIRSLKLLGEVLLDRVNFNIMMKYISSRHHLKLIMNTLRDKSCNIQVEAFHVFKLFVANPKKPPEISATLYQNKSKLVTYLEAFQINKDDGQFQDERDLLVETLATLEEPPPYTSNSSSSGRSGTSRSSSSNLPNQVLIQRESFEDSVSISSGEKASVSSDEKDSSVT